MKVEVLAPDKGNSVREFQFTALTKRLQIYPTDYPQFSKVFYTIVDKSDEIVIYRHGPTVVDVHAILKLKDDGNEVKL